MEVLEPLQRQQKEKADKLAAEEAERVRQAEEARQGALAAQYRPVYNVQPISYSGYSGTLAGSIGYARAGGNCVNEPGVNNPGYGNPSSWPATSGSPWIGATALWTYNHTGVVTGIWSNGDIEVRHQNFSGGIHRFPRSAFRGFR